MPPRALPQLDRPASGGGKRDVRLFLQLVNLKAGFLWWPSEPASNPLFHLRHQNFVAKLFPTFLGIMNRHNRPATIRRSRNV